MGAPKLRPGTHWQARADAAGDDELRTMQQGDPQRPRSLWHRARWWLHHHLSRENTGEWEDVAGWGASRQDRTARRSRRAGVSREQLREDVRLAQHAQGLREEAATYGGREERARFYGTGEHGVSGGGVERRITVADAERQRAAHEADQAQRYAGRRRASAEFRLPWEVD